MQRLLNILIILLLASSPSSAQPLVSQYQNPLDVSIADPQVLKDNGIYYLYGTTDDDGFSVSTSTDLVHWSRRGYCYTKTPLTWGQTNFWAPEVIKHGATYYLFYTAYNPASSSRNICVASAGSPLGPFIDVATPILPASMSFIDGHPYADPISGKIYLYALREDTSPPKIMVTELASPPTATVGNLTDVLTVTQPWEGSWVEAPFIVRHNSHYYMMYSARWFWEPAYSVGYATATNLLGPWTKSAANPILNQTATVSGPGHNSAIRSPDNTELYIVYHTHLTFAGGGPRQLAIDRLAFVPQSTGPALLQLQAGEPTTSLQPLPSGSVPKNYGLTDEFDSTSLDRTRWNTFGEEPFDWALSDGSLQIGTRNGDLFQDRLDARNIFLQYAPAGNFVIETRLSFSPLENFEQAFLIVWADQSNYIKLSRLYADGQKIEVANEVNGIYNGITINHTFGNPVRLKIEKNNNQCHCYAGSGSNSAWTYLGSLNAPPAPLQVGVGAMAPVSGKSRLASFNYFHLTAPASITDWQLYTEAPNPGTPNVGTLSCIQQE